MSYGACQSKSSLLATSSQTISVTLTPRIAQTPLRIFVIVSADDAHSLNSTKTRIEARNERWAVSIRASSAKAPVYSVWFFSSTAAASG